MRAKSKAAVPIFGAIGLLSLVGPGTASFTHDAAPVSRIVLSDEVGVTPIASGHAPLVHLAKQ
jgi:hypothetical protein